ncbi:MAG: 2-oxo acid dehydrogenase subunit E2, partial [Blastopirellula sp. JB062]
MATEVKLPELGDGIESGDILSVYVSEGDVVSKNQNILELETDKATVEIPTTVAGKIVKVHVAAGDAVPIGGALISVEAAEGAPAEEKQPEPKPKQEETPPKAEEKKAEPAPKAEPPKQVEAPKPAAAAPQPTPQPPAPPQPAVTYEAPATPAGDLIYQAEDDVPAGPAIRRFAREVGVDLRRVRGTGSNGRITRDDVLATVRQLSQGGGQAATLTAPAPPTAEKPAETPSAPPAVTPPGEQGEDAYGPVRIEKMPKIRKTIANQMLLSWTSAPRVTNFDDADVTALEALRQQSKDDYAEAGVKLTSMSFLVKAVALALRNNPAINALIDMENNQVVYKEYVNVGIAVD